MQRFLALLVRSFLKGLLILLPVTLTGYILWSIFTGVDELVPGVPRGTGFLIIMAAITAIGFIGLKWSVGQVVFEYLGSMLTKAPGIRHIYSSIKDILDSFVGDKRKFNRPVWVRTSENPEMWRIGFLTQPDMGIFGMADFVAVYLPHSYAISGWVVMVKPENIRPVTTMGPTEAMKFAVSGGVTTQTKPEPA